MGLLTVQLTESAESALKRIEEVAKSQGIQFQHDGQSGSFSHMGVTGSFTIKDNVVEIDYSKPPMFPESVVEDQIMQIFS